MKEVSKYSRPEGEGGRDSGLLKVSSHSGVEPGGGDWTVRPENTPGGKRENHLMGMERWDIATPCFERRATVLLLD